MGWHSKGNALLVGGKQPHFYIINEGGEAFQTFFGHEGDVTAAEFTPDGKQVVSVSADHSLRVWGPRDGSMLRKVVGHGFHELEVVSLALHPNNKLAVTGSTDGTCCLSNIQTGKALSRSEPFEQSVENVMFYAPQDLAAAGGVDGQLRLFDVGRAKTLRTFQFGSAVTCLAKNEAMNLLAVGCFDGQLRVFDPREQHDKGLPSIHLGSTIHRLRTDGDGLWACTEKGQLCFRSWRQS